MKIWFTHNDETLTTQDTTPGCVLPILDLNNQQHIVRWGANRYDHNHFPRGLWYRQDPLLRWGAIWVRVPAIRYQHATMYHGPLSIELDEPLAGALFRIPDAGARVYLVQSDVIGDTTVNPLLYSQLGLT